MSILQRLLEKRGIKSENELSEEEKKDFETWRKVLSKEELTIKDFEEFCSIQLNNIETQFKDLNNAKEKIEKLVLLHSVYSTLKTIINAPRAERDNLEKYLNQILDK